MELPGSPGENMSTETIIGEIKKNHYEYIRFILAEDSERKQYLVIKNFFRNGAGRMIATEKWVSFGPKRLERAIELMKEARARMEYNPPEGSESAAVAAVEDSGEN